MTNGPAVAAADPFQVNQAHFGKGSHMSTSCGVIDHDTDCLCDVIVRSITPIAVDPVRDGYLGIQIVNHLNLSVPYRPDDILTLLETQVKIHDLVANDELPTYRSGSVTPWIRQRIKELTIEGVSARQIREEIWASERVSISACHMSHLRKRVMVERSTVSGAA
jgi:hypothetical protein